jgi:energy-coupling factor transporter transmembrane protein EcfT
MARKFEYSERTQALHRSQVKWHLVGVATMVISLLFVIIDQPTTSDVLALIFMGLLFVNTLFCFVRAFTFMRAVLRSSKEDKRNGILSDESP